MSILGVEKRTEKTETRDGRSVAGIVNSIENPIDAKTNLELLLIGGVPLNEPISRYGPFVMNTEREIHRALEDYCLGRMGAIKA